jgi:ADP-ribose pyrophosphatase
MEPVGVRTAWRGRFVQIDLEDWPPHTYEVVRTHDAVAVVPVTPAGEVLLVRQFRPPARDTLLEIPAGLLDVPGEDAITCARRELMEETGYRAASIAFLGGAFMSPGHGTEYAHLFWARTGDAAIGEPEDGIELVTMPLHRAVAAARGGRVRDAMSALGLLLAAGVPALQDEATDPS